MKIYILSLFLLTATLSSAQVKGKLINNKTNEPVPYVNIWIENESYGTTSDINGYFQFSKNHNSSNVVFSAIGYKTKVVEWDSIDEIIKLESHSVSIQEVTIRSKKESIEKVVGAFKKSKINKFFACSLVPKVRAKYFAYDNTYLETPYLGKIRIDTDSDVKNAKFNIRLYSMDENGKPDEYLYDENIIGLAKKGFNKITEIDISHLNILIPEEGMFISFEWLLIEENKFEDTYQLEGSKKKYKAIAYAPNVGTIPSTTRTNDWELDGGVWKKVKQNASDDFSKRHRDKFDSLAIELTLTN